jgi:1-hydroxycarotenoid 3,4-desaturase
VRRPRIVVVGAGMGGLAAAIDCAARGAAVTIVDKEPSPGGKARSTIVGGRPVEGGPTVFTMRWIFEGLFADAGASLAERLALTPASVLARHAWTSGGRLDLHASDDASAEAIAAFAGRREADGFRRFLAEARAIHDTLAGPFIAAERPGPLDLALRVGLGRLGALWRTRPFARMAGALAGHFADQRLRQLFGRYATYCGSSPYLAPATLMLVAAVEQDGVALVEGGIGGLARAMGALAAEKGAEVRLAAEAEEILVRDGRACGVRLCGGETLAADAVIFNGDVSALAEGRLGLAARGAARATPRPARSLSAVTMRMAARCGGFPLSHHSVFFAEDYREEFDAIFRRRTVCADPTVYLCAQDRPAAAGAPASEGAERILMLVNAPADGGGGAGPPSAEILDRGMAVLARCGLEVAVEASEITDPAGFERLFPATGGALYGPANHGPFASFARRGARSRLAGLYLCGGSVHPGPGAPMAAMSGRIAAARCLSDLDGRRGAIALPAPPARRG